MSAVDYQLLPDDVAGEHFREILADAKRGSEEAFAVLYRELAPAVLGFARGRGALDPEEALAETMISVARSIASFEGDEAAFRSFVFKIAYRRLADARRRSFRRVREEPLEWASEVAGPGNPADEVAEDFLQGPVFAALRLLKPVQRDVVLLRVVGDLPLSQVAAIVSKSETAVKMIQIRALERLRSLISADVANIVAQTDSEGL